jgi:predicted nucleic acid-binding protein
MSSLRQYISEAVSHGRRKKYLTTDMDEETFIVTLQALTEYEMKHVTMYEHDYKDTILIDIGGYFYDGIHFAIGGFVYSVLFSKDGKTMQSVSKRALKKNHPYGRPDILLTFDIIESWKTDEEGIDEINSQL